MGTWWWSSHCLTNYMPHSRPWKLWVRPLSLFTLQIELLFCSLRVFGASCLSNLGPHPHYQQFVGRFLTLSWHAAQTWLQSTRTEWGKMCGNILQHYQSALQKSVPYFLMLKHHRSGAGLTQQTLRLPLCASKARYECCSSTRFLGSADHWAPDWSFTSRRGDSNLGTVDAFHRATEQKSVLLWGNTGS